MRFGTRTKPVRVPVAMAAFALSSVLLAGCTMQGPVTGSSAGGVGGPGDAPEGGTGMTAPTQAPSPRQRVLPADEPARGTVTLGFAGDVHFEQHLRSYLDDGPGALGPVTAALRAPDVMMLNLETALTDRGAPEPKLYNFRAPPRSLATLRAAGVDVVSLANNHAADYGAVGVADTLAAVEDNGLPAVGFGEDLEAALTPYRTEVRGTDIAVFAMSDRPDSTASNWYARPDRPGIIAHRHIPLLADAVAQEKRTADVVVVYAHWGAELASCPNDRQRALVAALSDAGVDVLVGAHTHVLLGSGWRGDTYVSYGLGNFVWYNDYRPDSGILTLTVRDGEVVADEFAPALIERGGRPRPLAGAERDAALAEWEALRGCTDLSATPPAS